MKKVAVFLAEGFEEVEALTVVDVLRRAGIECKMISIMDSYNVISSHKVSIKADNSIDELNLDEFDMIVFPGGIPGAINLANDERIIKLIRKFNEDEKKYIAAICASPAVVLSKAGIEEGRYITSYPGEQFESLLEKANYVEELVVVDGNLITSRGPATTMLFAYKLVDILGGDSESLKAGMLWNKLEDEGKDEE